MSSALGSIMTTSYIPFLILELGYPALAESPKSQDDPLHVKVHALVDADLANEALKVDVEQLEQRIEDLRTKISQAGKAREQIIRELKEGYANPRSFPEYVLDSDKAIDPLAGALGAGFEYNLYGHRFGGRATRPQTYPLEKIVSPDLTFSAESRTYGVTIGDEKSNCFVGMVGRISSSMSCAVYGRETPVTIYTLKKNDEDSFLVVYKASDAHKKLSADVVGPTREFQREINEHMRDSESVEVHSVTEYIQLGEDAFAVISQTLFSERDREEQNLIQTSFASLVARVSPQFAVQREGLKNQKILLEKCLEEMLLAFLAVVTPQ